MAKKKKNSNYHYLSQKQEQERAERERAEKKAKKRRNTWAYIIGLVLLTTGFVVCLLEYTKVVSGLSPFFVGISAIGLFFLWYTFKETREKYSKACLLVGALCMIYSFFLFKDLYID